ncbi:Ras-related protein Rab-24, partial [Caligus rogercresseyi]
AVSNMSLTKFLSKRKRRERKISAGIIPDFKVVTLGESGCGKTSLVQWFLRQRPLMNKELGATVAASFSRHTFEESPGEGGPMMGLWDTAGSERYCALAKLYYRDAFGAILCYDVSDYHSWDRLRYWINELNENKPGCRLYIVAARRIFR